MFTVLVIVSCPAVTSFYVRHFSSLAQAQAFQPLARAGCTVKPIIMQGELSEEQAIAEYLD